MSGVFGQRLGRKNSLTSVVVSSVTYSMSSAFVVRQVKYVYDWVKPSFARRYITFGRVNASARNRTSGCSAFTPPISHSQKANVLVWGLSTRKIFPPWPIQKSTTSFSASQRLCQSSLSKSIG